jgi:hypothetical protein
MDSLNQVMDSLNQVMANLNQVMANLKQADGKCLHNSQWDTVIHQHNPASTTIYLLKVVILLSSLPSNE